MKTVTQECNTHEYFMLCARQKRGEIRILRVAQSKTKTKLWQVVYEEVEK